jgi:hypothetical protein
MHDRAVATPGLAQDQRRVEPSGAPPARITVGPGSVVGEEAFAIARLTYAPRSRCQGRSDQPSGPTVTLVYMPQNAVTKMNRTPMICT